MKDRFIDFLIDNNVFDSFIEQAEADSACHENIDSWLNSCNPDDYIMLAFVWSDATEGVDLWVTLSNRWDEIVDKG